MKKGLLVLALGMAAGLMSQVASAITVFVVQNANITRFESTTGEYLGTLANGFAGSGYFSAKVCPTDGNLYAAAYGPGVVQRFDPYTGEYKGSLGTGFLTTPYDIKFGPDGLLYVSNYASPISIMRFDPVTGEYKGQLGVGFINGPARMEFTADGTLHVVEYGTAGKITRFDPVTGEYKGSYASGFANNEFGIVADANGKILISSYNSASQVKRFVPDTGEYQGTFASGFINTAACMAVAPNNIVLVGTALTSNGSSLLGNAVMRFDATTGEYLGHFGFGFLQNTVWDIAPELMKTYSGTIDSNGINVTGEQFTFKLKDQTTGAVLDTVTAPVTDAAGHFTFKSYVRGNFRITGKTRKRLSDSTNVAGNNLGASGILLHAYPGDSNNDDTVNLVDFSKMSSWYGLTNASPIWSTVDAGNAAPTYCDWNNDNVINLLDFSLLSSNYGRVGVL